jgi:hypothetical protein
MGLCVRQFAGLLPVLAGFLRAFLEDIVSELAVGGSGAHAVVAVDVSYQFCRNNAKSHSAELDSISLMQKSRVLGSLKDWQAIALHLVVPTGYVVAGDQLPSGRGRN